MISSEYLKKESIWKETNLDKNWKGIDVTNTIFRSNEEMNLNFYCSEIFFDITLKRNSTFWLILRSNKCFDKFSAILKISKDDKSQKVFASYGTFILDDKLNLIFKVFLKQQIINISKSNKIYRENDVSRIKGIVIDYGQEKIVTRLYRIHYFN